MTLTYNPSLAKGKVNFHTKNQGRGSNGSAVRVLTDTQTHTHGTDSMTLTADAGGNNVWSISYRHSLFDLALKPYLIPRAWYTVMSPLQ